MQWKCENGSVSLQAGSLVWRHSAAQPALFFGEGKANVEMFHGNFELTDTVVRRSAARECRAEQTPDGVRLVFANEAGTDAYAFTVCEQEGRVHLHGESLQGENRVWLRLPAAAAEHIYGGGEQFTYFDLRGHRFPIWSSEQGVGRNKALQITQLADASDHGGGDYFWTFFPQATFVSDANYYCHIEDSCYTVLDFTRQEYHELAWWSGSFSLIVESGASLRDTVCRLSNLLGRPPMLPQWALQGAWLGIQGGCDAVDQKLDAMEQAGCHVTAVWCQDWSGIRMTSFGKRVWWDWKYQPELYPDLPRKIKEWNARGVRFQGYINPYVCADGTLYQEAADKGYLVRNAAGEPYLVDFGEFYGGMPDFTNPEAFAWYKQVIIHNMIDIGLSGWMADFGEYLPTDSVLFSGESAMLLHNRWPALWAQLNYEAVRDAGKLGEIVFYMRAGGTGSQHSATLMWAGDQNVDFSTDDGLPSVVTAALSSGMTGSGLHTSDIGGYTTLFELHRTKELLLRWAEFCAFTPVMRTHEGNRPASNHQFDTDAQTAAAFARCVRVHDALSPYTTQVVEAYVSTGLPAMRPLALAFPQDPCVSTVQYEYMLGEELLCAPVCEAGASAQRVYLPSGEWIHLWTGAVHTAGWQWVDAPLGKPAVFYQRGCSHAQLFNAIAAL